MAELLSVAEVARVRFSLGTPFMDIKIEPSWKEALKEEFSKPYFAELVEFVRKEYKSKKVYPPPKFVFRAFELCPFNKVRAVILGQDPYHGEGQAHGLSFSVPEGVRMPPSLQNIYKEIQGDLGLKTPARGPLRQSSSEASEARPDGRPESGNLEHWAKQGVFLLNATLTVRAGNPGSHQDKGWEQFTDAVIKTLSDKKEYLVFLLWGKYAQEKGAVIDRKKHLVLTAAHPSPYSASSGFFGCRHFSKTNEYLKKHGKDPIRWV